VVAALLLRQRGAYLSLVNPSSANCCKVFNLGTGQEAGDPAKAVEAVIKVVETTEPPLRFCLGNKPMKQQPINSTTSCEHRTMERYHYKCRLQIINLSVGKGS